MTDSPSSPTPDAGAASRRGSATSRLGAFLRRDTVGGLLLVVAAVLAIGWANSPWADGYFAFRDFEVGFEPWHLRLSLGAWAADGLLAVFFFLVGLELKREFVKGSLRDPKRAIVPVLAAAGGVAVPALIYLAVTWSHESLRVGWAIPAATDIAFAVAVLAIIGSHLPPALRLFLLALAVVDDLIAIAIIAVFYTAEISLVPFAISLAVIAVYGVIAQRGERLFRERAWAAWVILLPLGVVAWGFLHTSGVHATIAGVLLAMTIPVRRPRSEPGSNEPGLADGLEHRLRPLSAGFAVPVFAFFAAGVALGGIDGLARALSDPVTIGVVAGLVLGKPLGILLTTRVVTAVSSARLDSQIRWIDLLGVSLLAGIGFTVSLLIAELSFGLGTTHNDDAKIAILAASLLATTLASCILLVRNRRYRQNRA